MRSERWQEVETLLDEEFPHGHTIRVGKGHQRGDGDVCPSRFDPLEVIPVDAGLLGSLFQGEVLVRADSAQVESEGSLHRFDLGD